MVDWSGFGLRLLAAFVFWLLNILCFYLCSKIVKSRDVSWTSASRSSLAFAVAAFGLSYLPIALSVLSGVLLLVVLLYLAEEYYTKDFKKIFLFALIWLVFWAIALFVIFLLLSLSFL